MSQMEEKGMTQHKMKAAECGRPKQLGIKEEANAWDYLAAVWSGLWATVSALEMRYMSVHAGKVYCFVLWD